MRGLIWICILLFTWSFGHTQNPAVFLAKADTYEVSTGGYVEVSFILSNVQGSNFKAPSFSGFRIVEGPSIRSEYSISNGRSSQIITHSFTLLATKEGNFSIGSASIQAGSKRLATKPFNIKVNKGKEPTGIPGEENLPSDRKVFVRAEVSDTIAYIGQQITVNYKLYDAENIQSYYITSQPDFDGFFVDNVKDAKSSYKREEINGTTYRTRILKTYALFPQRTGIFNFEPMYLKLGIPSKERRNRSFFFNRDIKTFPVNTNGINLEIRSLPEPAPESFSGAVGKYTMRAYVDENDITTDEALSITMDIIGNGDGRKISAPDFKFPPQFEQYDPKELKDESIEKDGSITNYKSFEFVAVPINEGRYRVAPQFTYFDVDSARYMTLERGPFMINVEKGTRPRSESRSFVSDAEELIMKPPYSDFKPGKGSQPMFGTNTFWGLTGVSALGFLALLGFKYRESNKEVKDPGQLKMENATRLALEKMERAKAAMDSNSERQFYEEIALAFWGYASDKLQIDVSILTKEMLKEKLTGLEINPQTTDDYLKVLNDCEMVNYAGVSNTDMNSMYQHCIQLISSLEQEI